MKILITGALFPPDIADPAPYLKELAKRLSTDNDVSVLLYGSRPEAISGVPIRTVTKEWPSFLRLLAFVAKMLWLAPKHDVILVQNGIATELPALILSRFFGQKMILQMTDQKVTYQKAWQQNIHSKLADRVNQVLSPTDTPLPPSRPEVLPFTERPEAALRAYESAWETHLTELTKRLSS